MLSCRCSQRAGFKDKSFARKDGGVATEEGLAVLRPCECEEADTPARKRTSVDGSSVDGVSGLTISR